MTGNVDTGPRGEGEREEMYVGEGRRKLKEERLVRVRMERKRMKGHV